MNKFILVVLCCLLAACAPKVGSRKWCANLAETPKGDWTLNNAKAYASHCLFPRREDK